MNELERLNQKGKPERRFGRHIDTLLERQLLDCAMMCFRMVDLVEEKREELARLCMRFRVLTLGLFGSATRDDFDDQNSDLDFVVEFTKLSSDEHARSYFGLLKELERLFGRKVDLVEVSAVRNPYIRRNIEDSRVTVYAA